MSKLVTWNGRDLPEELRGLPAGRYVIEPVDQAPPLTAEEEAGLEKALASLRRGAGVEPERARAILDSTSKH